MCYAERKDVFYIPDGWDGYSDISSSEDEVDPDNVPPVPGSQGFIASPERSPPSRLHIDVSGFPPVPTYDMISAAGFGARQLAEEVEQSDDDTDVGEGDEFEPEYREGDDEDPWAEDFVPEGVDEDPAPMLVDEEEEEIRPVYFDETQGEADAESSETEDDNEEEENKENYQHVGKQSKRYVPFHRRAKLRKKKKKQKGKRKVGRPRTREEPTNKRSCETLDKFRDDMESSGIDPDYIPGFMRKESLAGRGTWKAMKRLGAESKGGKHIIRKICDSEELFEIGCTTFVKEQCGINPRTRLKEEEMSQPLENIPKQVRSIPKWELVKAKAYDFYMSDMYSRCSPGKNDYVKVGTKRLQKRICNDYVKNLHVKFLAENPDLEISLSKFYECRPAQVLTSKYLNKDTTCCQKHQNFQLLIKALDKILPRVKCVTSPDAFIEEYDTEEKIQDLLNTFNEESHEGMVVYEQWGRVKTDDNKTKTRIIRVEEAPAEFLQKFYERYIMFVDHNTAANHQYFEQRKCKENLKPGECMVQVDFIQNYACLVADGLQSSFFDQTQVTIHASVVYYREREGEELQHKSYIHVSPINEHNSSMVYAIINKFWTEDFAKEKNDLGIHTVHYYSDSPFSQYRNKWIFHLISKHQEMYGIKATWDYFETGHGKGPCDGVGGTIKRMADQAQKQGTRIQDAKDFMEWANTTTSLNLNVSYISEEYFQTWKDEYNKLNDKLTSLKGTKKLHAVRPTDTPDVLEWRDLSCKCGNDPECDCEWKRSSIKRVQSAKDAIPNHDTDYEVGENVILEFRDNVYLCRVMEELENGFVSFKAYYKDGDHFGMKFQMLRSGRRIVYPRADILHRCGDLLSTKRQPDIKKLNAFDQKVFNDFTDILMV